MHQSARKDLKNLILPRALVAGGIVALALVGTFLYLIAGSSKTAWIKVGAVNESDTGLTIQLWVWTSPDVSVTLSDVSMDDHDYKYVSPSGSVSTNQPTNPGILIWPWSRYGLSFAWDWMNSPFSDLTPKEAYDRLELREGQGYWLRGDKHLRIIEVGGKVLVLNLQEL